jgi:LmbE family N-acetylglucosaminyl deacetylase
MRRLLAWCAVFALGLAVSVGLVQAQTRPAVEKVKGPDERMKADILVVVAHPDDEGGVTPYLARAIYDEHKRVAVVFATRGGSGGNDYSREHGPALADIREQEARAACAKLGITNVWFLEGKDTASQNVLNSLANWGHGVNLEALVRIVRLTRPEVIITWLPGIFIGENHGDHQAAGVLATEAFDLANDPTAFPAQVAGATKRLEVYLENLTPWQPKKLYFFSDAEDQKQFDGTGPAYSIKEISPSQKKSYWQLALEAAAPHLTQFPQAQELQKMTDEQLKKFMEDPNNMFWPEPMTLIFGKAAVQTKSADGVFASVNSAAFQAPTIVSPVAPAGRTWLELGGPWLYYDRFRPLHHLEQLKATSVPEIGIRAGAGLMVPLTVFHRDGEPIEIEITVTAPTGWKVMAGTGKLRLPEESRTDLLVEIATPELTKEELKKLTAQELIVRGSVAGKSIGEVRLMAKLRASALAQ